MRRPSATSHGRSSQHGPARRLRTASAAVSRPAGPADSGPKTKTGGSARPAATVRNSAGTAYRSRGGRQPSATSRAASMPSTNSGRRETGKTWAAQNWSVDTGTCGSDGGPVSSSETLGTPTVTAVVASAHTGSRAGRMRRTARSSSGKSR